MCADKVASSKRSIQTQFASQDSGGDYAGKLSCVVTWVGWVRATDAEKIEHRGLRFKDGAAANGAYLNGGHGD
jgi:hypothetical protein